MSEFFEPTPAEPDDLGLDEEMPPWVYPPVSVLPGLVADRRLLARAGPVALLLSHIDAYPVGCNLVLRIVARRPAEMGWRDWHEWNESLMNVGVRRAPGASGEEPLRFGLRFADGTKVIADRGFHGEDGPPDTPVLVLQDNGGGGGGRTVELEHALWSWPLPPAEPFELVFDWQAMGIGLHHVVIDGAAIAAAAQQASEPFA